MNVLSKASIALWLAGWVTTVSCSSSKSGDASNGETGDASAEAGGNGAVTCGGTACDLPKGAGIETLTPCCTDGNECGLQFPGASKCQPRDLPGMLAIACDPLTIVGGVVLKGCCGPEGCGVMDPFLGCMPNTVLGRSGGTCAYDPNNDCTELLGVPCDGAEDCPTGQQCCGKFDGDHFSTFGCYPSCTALEPDASPYGGWRQLCHAGDVCENSSYTCRTSDYLPTFLTRCQSVGMDAPPPVNTEAGKVSCGTTACGTGEKCCLRPPHDPYCAPASADCECRPAGVDSGGVP